MKYNYVKFFPEHISRADSSVSIIVIIIYVLFSYYTVYMPRMCCEIKYICTI